jgi:hypothetical protein
MSNIKNRGVSIILSNKNPKEWLNAKHAPIMRNGATLDKPVRIRVLLSKSKKRPIGFRRNNGVSFF